MQLVVDASVIVGVCYAGGELGPLRGHALHAPPHLAAEVTSAIRESAFRGDIPAGRASEALGFLTAVPIAFGIPGARAVDVLRLAEQLGWAKTYDAEYVDLAQTFGAPLVTLDDRLRRGAARVVRVITPSELQPTKLPGQ